MAANSETQKWAPNAELFWPNGAFADHRKVFNLEASKPVQTGSTTYAASVFISNLKVGT